MSDFGIPDPTITVIPEIYGGSIKAAKDPEKLPPHYLPYEWSAATKIDPDSTTQWHEFMARAQLKVEESMTQLRSLYFTRWPESKTDESVVLKTARNDARRLVDTYMNHDPNDPGYVDAKTGRLRNEVPRWRPDGTLHPDDAKFLDEATGMAKDGSPLVFEPPAQSNMESLLYRIPRETMEEQYWQGTDDAATRITRATEYLSWSDSPVGHPDAKQAYKLLREAKIDLRDTLRNAGVMQRTKGLGRIMEYVHDMTPGEMRIAGISAAVGAGLLAAVTVGVIVHHDD